MNAYLSMLEKIRKNLRNNFLIYSCNLLCLVLFALFTSLNVN